MKSKAVTAAVENNHATPLANTKSSKKKRKNHTKIESQRSESNKNPGVGVNRNTVSSVVSYQENEPNQELSIQSINKALENNLHISKNGCRIDLLDDYKSKNISKLLNNDPELAKKNEQSIINGDEGVLKKTSEDSLELIKNNGNFRDIYQSHNTDSKSNFGLRQDDEMAVDRDNLYCHKITTVDSFETSSYMAIKTSTEDVTPPLPTSLDSNKAEATESSVIKLDPIGSKNIIIDYKVYESELQMPDIMRLIQAELSEPYSIYTYRYFIYNWPKLCFLAAHGTEYVGAIVCKLDMHRNVKRGYIAMLAVKQEYRKLKIGTTLVEKAIEAMLVDNAEEVVLETERKNIPALRLYENLGFVRDKRLFRYYLNGVDALRLKLWFR